MTDEPNDKKTASSDAPVTTQAAPPVEATKPPISWQDIKDCDGDDFKRL